MVVWVEHLGAIMTEQELQEIEERVKAATPGPWDLEIDGRDAVLFVQMERPPNSNWKYVAQATSADYKFLAHARSDVPALVQMVRHLQAIADFRMSDYRARAEKAEAEVVKLRATLKTMIEVADDVYSQSEHWYQWKYGDWFSEELAKARTLLGDEP